MFHPLERLVLCVAGLCVAAVSVSGCRGRESLPTSQPEEPANVAAADQVAIAKIGSVDDDTRNVVRQELARASIPCWFEGSVVHAVLVQPKDAARARELLHQARELQGHWVEILDQPPTDTPMADSARVPETKP